MRAVLGALPQQHLHARELLMAQPLDVAVRLYWAGHCYFCVCACVPGMQNGHTVHVERRPPTLHVWLCRGFYFGRSMVPAGYAGCP